MTELPLSPTQGAQRRLDAIVRPFRRSEWGLLLAVLVVVVLTGLLDTQHTYVARPWASVVEVLRYTSLQGVFALGAAIVIIAGGIDLSSGSVIAFSGSVCAALLLLLAPDQVNHSLPIPAWVIVAAIAGTLAVGFFIGSLHAWLITVIGLPPFVATLATLVGLRSLARILVAAASDQATKIYIADKGFRYLATSVWVPVLLFVALAGMAWLLMSRTVVGRHLHALGGNEQAARLSGIQTDRLKWLAYCISAVLSALAGILYLADSSSADPTNLGQGYELNAIAAAVVGGCSLQGGVGTIPGTVLGVLFLRVVLDGVAKVIKASAQVYEGLVVGLVVIFAVALTQLRQGRRQGKRFFAGALGIVTIVNLSLMAGLFVLLFVPAAAGGGMTLASIVATAVLGLLILARYLEGRGSSTSAKSS